MKARQKKKKIQPTAEVTEPLEKGGASPLQNLLNKNDYARLSWTPLIALTRLYTRKIYFPTFAKFQICSSKFIVLE